MPRWSDFAAAAPELASDGERLLSQYGVGLGYLATVGRDGAPRIHPVCPLIFAGGLYVFVVPSPKRHDLVRDGRYALHAFPCRDTDDEFCITGRAGRVIDAHLREAAVAAYHLPVPQDHELFELSVERAMLARYRHRGDWPPTYAVWRASRRA